MSSAICKCYLLTLILDLPFFTERDLLAAGSCIFSFICLQLKKESAMNPKWKVSINSQIRRDGYHIFSFWGMCLLFYFIAVGGKWPCQGPGLVSGKTPVSICLFAVSALLKSALKARGCPLKGQKTAPCGQQSHFWNHHRSHGWLTCPQSSPGGRCFRWTSQRGGCRKAVGSSRHPPASGSHSPETVHCRGDHSLFKCPQGTDRAPFHQNNQNWCDQDLTVRCHKTVMDRNTSSS